MTACQFSSACPTGPFKISTAIASLTVSVSAEDSRIVMLSADRRKEGALLTGRTTIVKFSAEDVSEPFLSRPPLSFNVSLNVAFPQTKGSNTNPICASNLPSRNTTVTCGGEVKRVASPPINTAENVSCWSSSNSMSSTEPLLTL